MGRGNGNTARVLRLLGELGPMTRAEICRELGPDAKNISSLVSILIRKQPLMPRRAHICAWVFDMDGERRYPRAVYALGDEPNAKRPKPQTRAQVVANYRMRLTARYKSNSVFNLARTQKDINAVSKMRQPEATHTRVKANRDVCLAQARVQDVPSHLADGGAFQRGAQDADRGP